MVIPATTSFTLGFQIILSSFFLGVVRLEKAMSIFEHMHGGYIYGRRAHVLSKHLAKLIPQNGRVLDIGCGDGLVLTYNYWPRQRWFEACKTLGLPIEVWITDLGL